MYSGVEAFWIVILAILIVIILALGVFSILCAIQDAKEINSFFDPLLKQQEEEENL